MLSNTIPAEPPFSQPRVINTAEKAGKKPYVKILVLMKIIAVVTIWKNNL